MKTPVPLIVIASLLPCTWLIACGAVPIDPLPDTSVQTAPDVVADVAIDINQDITLPDGGADAKKDIDPNAKEICNNGVDDNGDGRIDENCWPAPNLRADETWYDFGTIAIGGAPGMAPTRTFDAPGKDQGMVLVARDITAGQKGYVWAEQLVTPGGLHEIGSGDQWATSPNRAYPSIAGATALIGESPDVTVSAGQWTFGFVRALQVPWQYTGTPAKGFLQVGLLTRPDNTAQKQVAIDLDVFLVGGTTGMTPDVFAKSLQWQQMRGKIEALWNGKDKVQVPIGIVLGNVQFFALDGDAGTKFKYLDNVLAGDDTNELVQVYQATGALRPTSTAATLVLVSALNDNNLSVAAGLSQLGGINGLANSRMSGMAVAIDEKTWNDAVAAGAASTAAADVWGVIIAHEIGHFMGLWHTDEHDGSLHDPLGDTPECQATGTLTPAACGDVIARNLMFWAPDSGGKLLSISADQHAVVRRSPVLHTSP